MGKTNGDWKNQNALLVQNVPHGTPKWIRDVTLNDSDKDFVVPSGKVWIPKAMEFFIVTSATAGNRIIGIFVMDNARNNVITSNESAPIGSGISNNMRIAFGSYMPATRNGMTVGIDDSMPELILTEGMIINVKDRVHIDAAADDLTVNLHVIEFDAAFMEA